jgi:hypothetical protein
VPDLPELIADPKKSDAEIERRTRATLADAVASLHFQQRAVRTLALPGLEVL